MIGWLMEWGPMLLVLVVLALVVKVADFVLRKAREARRKEHEACHPDPLDRLPPPVYLDMPHGPPPDAVMEEAVEAAVRAHVSRMLAPPQEPLADLPALDLEAARPPHRRGKGLPWTLEDCRYCHGQACHVCTTYTCCDNTNPDGPTTPLPDGVEVGPYIALTAVVDRMDLPPAGPLEQAAVAHEVGYRTRDEEVALRESQHRIAPGAADAHKVAFPPGTPVHVDVRPLPSNLRLEPIDPILGTMVLKAEHVALWNSIPVTPYPWWLRWWWAATDPVLEWWERRQTTKPRTPT